MAPLGIHFNRETKEVYSKKADAVELDERGLGCALYSKMKNYAKQGLVAQIDAVTGHKDYFMEYLTRCVHLAHSMISNGIKPGDVVAIITYNHLNSSLPYIAGQFIGAITATSDPSISIEDQRHLLNIVKPKLVFVSHSHEKSIEEALRPLEFEYEIITFSRVKSSSFRTIFSLIEEQINQQNMSDEEMIDAFQPVVANDAKDTCLILFSSGTTGLPKGISLNHYFIMTTFSATESFKDIRPNFLLYSSLYWLSAIVFQTSCFYFAYPRIVCTAFDPTLIWEYIEQYKVQILFLAPIQAILSLEHLRKRRLYKHDIKIFLMAGSAIAPNYLQEYRDRLPGAHVISGYGQTELGVVSIFPTSDHNYKTKLTSVGYLALNCIARIVDPDTEELMGLNKSGEIRIKTPHVMNGYYNQDSSSVWDAHGFLKTGDIGYFDDDLCLFITDRLKEMFKYLSWHIVPTKLESILQEHQDVVLAMVMGIPHPTDDNHAIGLVTVVPYSTVTAKELELFVEERVDERNRLRAGVVILQDMPMTPSGKIMRSQLKKMILKSIQSPIETYA